MTITPLYDTMPIGVGNAHVNNPQGSNNANNAPYNPAPSTYQWIVSWVVVIILAAAAAQTEFGYTVIYYALVLILVVLLVTQYQFIATSLAPLSQSVPVKG